MRRKVFLLAVWVLIWLPVGLVPQVLRGKFGATDILIVHKGCVLAVEIDGEQHLEKPYNNQPQLDAAKDEAYWEAGINLLRVHHKYCAFSPQ